MALSSQDWIQVFLLLAQKHLPLSFTSLSRHSNDLDNLFLELVANINTDCEVAKLGSGLCMIKENIKNKSTYLCFQSRASTK